MTKTGLMLITGVFIKKQLDILIKRQIIINAIKVCLFLIAIFIPNSLYISSLILTGIFIHTAIGFFQKMIAIVPVLCKYKLFILLFLKRTSPSEILAEYILLCHPWFFRIKPILDEKLRGWIPSADELVSYVWAYVGKRALVFGISFTVFLVSFNLFVRPMLQESMLGIGWIKIYFVPFFMAIDTIFKTDLMLYIIP